MRDDDNDEEEEGSERRVVTTMMVMTMIMMNEEKNGMMGWDGIWFEYTPCCPTLKLQGHYITDRGKQKKEKRERKARNRFQINYSDNLAISVE